MPEGSLTEQPPDFEAIASNFDIGTVKSIKTFEAGRVNQTMHVVTDRGEFVLQRFTPLNGPELVEDIVAVTSHLHRKGFVVPLAIETIGGQRYVETGGRVTWMYELLSGEVSDTVTADRAHSTGELLGRFHTALLDLDYKFKHQDPGFHNTPFIMSELSQIVERENEGDEMIDLARAVLRTYHDAKHPEEIGVRIAHGDPKINNVIFEPGGGARGFIDFEETRPFRTGIDIADGLRSWSKKSGSTTTFDIELASAGIVGYISKAEFFTTEERAALPEEIGNVMLELTARYLVDAVQQTNFILDKSQYDTAMEQNTDRARMQFEEYSDYKTKEEHIRGIIVSL